MFNLHTRTRKTTGSAPLYTRLRFGHTNKWVCLNLMVDINTWNRLDKTTTKLQNFLDKHNLTKKLVEIEFGIKELKKKNIYSLGTVQQLVEDISLKEQRLEMLERERIKREVVESVEKSVSNYVNIFVQGIEDGSIRNMKGEYYGDGTIKVWRQFRRILFDFIEICPFTWNTIDQTLINRFITYLERDCDYLKKTRNKYLCLFRQIISDSEKQGYHNNSIAKHLVKKLNVRDNDKTKSIYLTKEELDGLYGMRLEGTEEIVRDLFLIGTYTCQRFSDYSTINESCFGTTQNGTPVIRIQQQKTGNLVVIPILDDRLVSILTKYNYNPPTVSDQCFNRVIKQICEKLSETIPSLLHKEKTLLKKSEKEKEENGKCVYERDRRGNVYKPKWMLVCSHTCRRTGITLMYLSKRSDGTPRYSTLQMMSISGHTDEKTFRDYIKLSLDERAEGVKLSSTDGMF